MMPSVQLTNTPTHETKENLQQFCFCTLAIGAKYRKLAVDLAADLEKFSSQPLLILTDKPQDFNQSSQLLVFKHSQQSVGCYHDKRYVIAKALSLYDACVFVDADMRILKDVAHIQWQPGISARSCANILQHYQPVEDRPDRIKRIEMIKKCSQKFNLDLEQVNFVSEFMFAVAKDSGKEIKFLELWEKIGNYFELNGIYDSEGSVIGLAAAAQEFPLRHQEMPEIEFFNEKIDAIRIRKAQVEQEKLQAYFENHKQKAFPQRSLLEKITSRIGKFARYLYFLAGLRVTTLKDLVFYYS